MCLWTQLLLMEPKRGVWNTVEALPARALSGGKVLRSLRRSRRRGLDVPVAVVGGVVESS